MTSNAIRHLLARVVISFAKHQVKAVTDTRPAETPGIRGHTEHEVRARIVTAAEARFRHYGYKKTTVAEIASDLAISPAYVYKFYASKIALCEAILGEILGRIEHGLKTVASTEAPASTRLRLLFATMYERSVALYFNDRKLHDMILVGLDMRWRAVDRLKASMRSAVYTIVMDGRSNGEFETRTPIDDVVDAIWIALVPFAHPSVLAHLAEEHDLASHARHISDLALRGLART